MTGPSRTTSAPAVSVVLPFWNARETLGEAVESVLRQTWTDFELLLLDDGSDDGSTVLVTAIRDARVRLVRSSRHRGYAVLLNEGIAEARGEFIARMDADDVCHPARFARQIRLLRGTPDLAVCGTWARRFDATGPLEKIRLPPEHDDIACLALHAAPFVHPSVMFRREALPQDAEAYDASYSPAEDYHLWTRLLKDRRGANIPKVLLDYRASPGQASRVMAPEKIVAGAAIRRMQLERLDLEPDGPTFALHEAIFEGKWQPGEEFAASAIAWMETLVRANDDIGAFPPKALRRHLAIRARSLCQVGVRPAAKAWRMFRDSELGRELSAFASAAHIVCRL
jgi:glycosyltransferase involved in cell wall biosynthesis